MATRSVGIDALKHLSILSKVGTVGDLPDGQLLRRFQDNEAGNAEIVFTVLVERHGPMVMRVCQQTLGNWHDAQDAFQATFLVLARKANSVRDAQSLASWLHGVALRVSKRAKRDASRRRKHESQRSFQEPNTLNAGFINSETWSELHEELLQLPLRYREPVVLCYLEGLSTEKAARRIGCPVGTVMSRLSRGREQLRKRLVRRGVSISAVLFAACHSEATATSLFDATVRSSVEFAGLRTVEKSLTSATITTLARGVLHTMMISKLRVVGVAMVACALTLGGVRTFGLPFQTPRGTDNLLETATHDIGQAALSRSVKKLQAELDESDRRNAKMRSELQKLQSQLEKAQDVAQSKNGTAIQKMEEKGPRTTKTETIPQALEQITPIANQPFIRQGSFIITASLRGDKVIAFDTETSKSDKVEIGSPDVRLKITPTAAPGVVALHIEGPKISRIAAFTARTGTWTPIDLRECVEGRIEPIMGPDTATYIIGRYLYAFSGKTGKWDVIDKTTLDKSFEQKD